MSDWGSDVCSSDLFSAAGAHPADAESLAVWWRQFDDPQLTALVSRAMQQNHDVRLAMARVTAARAQLRQSRAGLLPSFDLPGSASRQWNENDQEAEPDSPLADFIPDDDVISFDTWELALQATWERSEEHTSELQSLIRISSALFCL